MIENLLEKNKKTDMFGNVLLFIILAILLCAIFVRMTFSCTRVDGESMMSTLHHDQYVILQRRGFTPKRGDIVTIDRKQFNGKKEPLIKRIIAVAGDKLLFMYDESDEFIDVYLCKKGENSFTKCVEPYADRMEKRNYKFINEMEYIPNLEEILLDGNDSNIQLIENNQVEVPSGQFFFMGDNRNDSNDSRGDYGMFEYNKIQGKVIKIVDMKSFENKFLDFIFKSAKA